MKMSCVDFSVILDCTYAKLNCSYSVIRYIHWHFSITDSFVENRSFNLRTGLVRENEKR